MSEMMQWVKYSNSLGFNFSGRARRREYWWNTLFYGIISLVASMIIGIVGGVIIAITESTLFIYFIDAVSGLLGLFIFLKMLPIAVRRYHDTGKSGWILLACYVGSCCCGIGGIIGLYFLIADSTPGDNMYGPNPKGIGGMGMNDMNGMGGMGYGNMNQMNGMNGMNGQNW